MEAQIKAPVQLLFRPEDLIVVRGEEFQLFYAIMEATIGRVINCSLEDLAVVQEDFQSYYAIPGNPPTPVFGGKKFGFATRFSGGLAAVSDEDGHLHEGSDDGKPKWYHIKPNGDPAYSERYHLVNDFQGGLAVVRKGDMWFYIRPDGSIAFQEFYDEAGPFCGGKARVRVGYYWWDIFSDGTPASKRSFCDRFGPSERQPALA